MQMKVLTPYLDFYEGKVPREAEDDFAFSITHKHEPVVVEWNPPLRYDPKATITFKNL